MTLTVCAYTEDIPWIDLGPGKYLFAFEVCRRDLWGHAEMESLGIRMLIELREYDLLVDCKEDFDTLAQDAHLILSNINLIARETKYDEEFIRFRIQNLLDAIAKAREVNGGVYVG